MRNIPKYSTPIWDVYREEYVHLWYRMSYVALPAHSVPVALMGAIFCELDRLVRFGVIVAIDDIMDWVSRIVVVTKKHGAIFLCIEPKHLNVALEEQHVTSA